MSDAETAPIPEGYAATTVRSNGIDLHLLRSGGSGPPVVLLHGFRSF